MKKYAMIYATIVASALTVLLMVGAATHIRVVTTRTVKDYWQNGERFVTEEIVESRFLTGEIIRTDTKSYTQFMELEEFFIWDVPNNDGFELIFQ